MTSPTQRTLTITVGLPHKALSPNARAHWRTVAKHKKAAKEIANFESRLYFSGREGFSVCPCWTHARTSIKWYTKTIRHPDPDNALASLKATFDGIRQSGLLADDNNLSHDAIKFEKDAKNPRVEITITKEDV